MPVHLRAKPSKQVPDPADNLPSQIHLASTRSRNNDLFLSSKTARSNYTISTKQQYLTLAHPVIIKLCCFEQDSPLRAHHSNISRVRTHNGSDARYSKGTGRSHEQGDTLLVTVSIGLGSHRQFKSLSWHVRDIGNPSDITMIHILHSCEEGTSLNHQIVPI